MKWNKAALAVCAFVLISGGVLQAASAQDTSAPAADESSVAPPATESAAPPAAETTTPPAADAAPPPAAEGAIGAAPADKGQIVFFRPSKLGGAALSFSVHEGAKGIGKLGNGQYFVILADPGIHEYSNQSEAKDTLRLEVEPGETYYVQQTIGMGIMMGRPHLTPSDAAAFGAKKLKLSTKAASDLGGE